MAGAGTGPIMALTVWAASLRAQLVELGRPEPLPPALLDLAVQHVDAGGPRLALLRPRDWSALREAEQDAGHHPPYWAVPWQSGQALARALAEERLDGRSTLEVGCGLAVVSIAAARAGAHVLATDGSSDAVAFAAHNLLLNGVEGETAVVGFDAAGGLLDGARFGLVLAADVLYNRRNVDLLLDLAGRAIGAGAEVLLADPGREGRRLFFATARRLWACETHRDAGSGITLHRMRARRGA